MYIDIYYTKLIAKGRIKDVIIQATIANGILEYGIYAVENPYECICFCETYRKAKQVCKLYNLKVKR